MVGDLPMARKRPSTDVCKPCECAVCHRVREGCTANGEPCSGTYLRRAKMYRCFDLRIAAQFDYNADLRIADSNMGGGGALGPASSPFAAARSDTEDVTSDAVSSVGAVLPHTADDESSDTGSHAGSRSGDARVEGANEAQGASQVVLSGTFHNCVFNFHPKPRDDSLPQERRRS